MKRESMKQNKVLIKMIAFGLMFFLLLLGCSSGPKIMSPLEIQAINNDIVIMSNSNDSLVLSDAANQAMIMANDYFDLQQKIGIDSILNKRIVISKKEGTLCSKNILESINDEVKTIIYGCDDEFDVMSIIVRELKGKSSDSLIIYMDDNNNSLHGFISPNHSFNELRYGGGYEFEFNKETNEINLINLDYGFLKTIPDRSLMHVRSSSKSNTPTVVDMFQFLTNKYFLPNVYVMTKDKSFWQMVFVYKENKNYVIKKITD